MEVTGLLYSQIGYDLKDPMRALVRSTDKDYIKEGSKYEIIDAKTSSIIHKGLVKYWGEKWKSSWWEIDFSELEIPGEYLLVIKHKGKKILTSDSFKAANHLLWDETMQVVALDQLETRMELSRNKKGWKDCGAAWREVNSHATMIIGLCDLMNVGFQWLSDVDNDRLAKQIIQGCDYIASCQDKSERLGFGEGSIIHEIPTVMLIIPGDIAQSTVAFIRASRLLSEINPDKSDEYMDRAIKAFEYLNKKAEYCNPEGFSRSNHGAPEDFVVPEQWMTRDLLMMMWGAFELATAGRDKYKENFIQIARMVMRRQIPKDKNEDGLYGHFYTFESCNFSEKANVHHHVGSYDIGATFPHYILPFIKGIEQWYNHPDVSLWKETVYNFAYGYFLPACSQNPFYLLPEGYFTGQGLLVFCGPWHGINTSIGFAASLAALLENYFKDNKFRNIAVGNIQWIAGLNAGITSQSIDGCFIWKEKIKEGVAEPYSQIYGIGRKHVGCWTNIKGTIPNGFSTNPQFQLTVTPTVENDGPWLYTDEDWIPHAAGWISALTNLRFSKFFND